VAALRTELQEALGLNSKEVVINQLTGHIMVKVRQLSDFFIAGRRSLGANHRSRHCTTHAIEVVPTSPSEVLQSSLSGPYCLIRLHELC